MPTDEAHRDSQQRSEFIALAAQDESGRDTHTGVCDKIGQRAQLGNCVAGSELVLDDDTHRAREISDKRYHKE